MNNLRNLLNIEHLNDFKGKIIGIGLGEDNKSNLRVVEAADEIISHIKKIYPEIHKNQKVKIIFVGIEKHINYLSESIQHTDNNLFFVHHDEPANYLINNLCVLDKKKDRERKKIDQFDAIIRGTLPSSDFLKAIRQNTENKIHKTYRLALLEDTNNNIFFFAPVGIDEINVKENKLEFVKNVYEFFNKIEVEASISILSGGRIGDLGRDPFIDKNIKETEEILVDVKEWIISEGIEDKITISHDYILIETAINKKSNVIIAPEGISGNLIYRTLVHLGKGKAYGAIYLNFYNNFNKIVIDTSRVAEKSEYEGAIKLALGV